MSLIWDPEPRVNPSTHQIHSQNSCTQRERFSATAVKRIVNFEILEFFLLVFYLFIDRKRCNCFRGCY